MKTLGGIITLRKADEFDFPWRESVRSLLPICDKVYLSVADDDPVTTEQVMEWQARDAKVVLVPYPWPNPVGDERYLSKQIQHCRERTETDMVLKLDADEALHEKDYPYIKDWLAKEAEFSLVFIRVNFIHDLHHIQSQSSGTGEEPLLRMCNRERFLPDHGDVEGLHPAYQNRVFTTLGIYHYTLLRHRDAYYRKQKSLIWELYGGDNGGLEYINEATNGDWMHRYLGNQFAVKWAGTHPAVMIDWLKERGYVYD